MEIKVKNISPELIGWVEKCIEEKDNGDVGLIFHIREGKVEWIEKINRTTEKPVKNPC